MTVTPVRKERWSGWRVSCACIRTGCGEARRDEASENDAFKPVGKKGTTRVSFLSKYMGFKYCKSIYWAPSERNQVNGGKCYGMYLVIWLLNGMRKGIERASGIEEVRKLGNGEAVMAIMPWAPKCLRDCAQRGLAAGKVSANAECWRTSAARAKQRTRSARKRDALLTTTVKYNFRLSS